MNHPPVGREPLEHAQARRLIDAFLLDDLAGPDAARLAAHVKGCPACAAELGGTTRLLALLGSLPTPPPAPDLDERILVAALRDRARRHEHRSWLATLWTQVLRGAVRTTSTLVVTIVAVALLGGTLVLAAGFITQAAFAPPPRATVHPDMTPTHAPTLVSPTVPATPLPAVTAAPTPAPTTGPEVTPQPTPAPTETPAVTAQPTAAPTETPAPTITPAPTPSPSATAEPTPEPSPTPVPTEKPRRTPPPSASPSPTPTPAPTAAPSPPSP
ncbi:MAG TPA: zf-HC2 domain-containing protein [Candidatus Nanopelagicales bacterium]|nr:zf-HC2 domain-containing protein [Candidatus Nanopelagicales bacterium]